MKTLIAALVALTASVATATTPETRMSTYPTRWRLIYDTDRDTSTGDQNYLIEGIGDALNGRVAGGTGTGLVTIYGDLDVTGAAKGMYFSESPDKRLSIGSLDAPHVLRWPDAHGVHRRVWP